MPFSGTTSRALTLKRTTAGEITSEGSPALSKAFFRSFGGGLVLRGKLSILFNGQPVESTIEGLTGFSFRFIFK